MKGGQAYAWYKIDGYPAYSELAFFGFLKGLGALAPGSQGGGLNIRFLGYRTQEGGAIAKLC